MAVNVVSEIPGINMEDLKLKGFKVHELPASADLPVSRGRRDFYKMGLVTGDMTVYYGDRILEIKDTVLFFVNPNVPHSVVRRSKHTTGYSCLFTETFITSSERTGILKNSPLFHIGDAPVIPLNSEQALFMTGIFQKMLAVHSGDYHYKGELIRSCIELIIHEALRIQPSQNISQFKNAATRITHLFMDLLERQFPIERSAEPLRLRTAQDFALSLSVHTNYLNRSVKEVTGKPTSVHIAERITAEAKALLQHTDWSVADIAYALGFEYPTYFNNYFKRVTGTTPKSIRK
ncbi:transcriptional regulator, AraC family [Mucilaginibacter frigoritolerans]|uniref:Transcriptional regulator, AraC family n=1 Tax=Mucilaginibacter frigoritolerans TaxID=652788 RepID=A0A562TNF0_9SPHI|nr:helix-turn-helix domain-containing protein [Mucilaginibacter frigoritolerans]TWI95101.1 transcriptional regulator, AraC family [Mucilaginibacter frigoritolerans]